MKNYLMVGTVVVICAWILVVQVWSQQASPSFVPAPASAGAEVPFLNPLTGKVSYQTYNVPTAQARSDIDQLMKTLNNADDEAKKTDITKKLEEAVAKYFDEDMKARETELTKIEERVKKLASQLDRRRKAKSEIIQLQLKVLINEAEGLGFGGTSILEPAASPAVITGPAGTRRYYTAPQVPGQEGSKASEYPRVFPALPAGSKP